MKSFTIFSLALLSSFAVASPVAGGVAAAGELKGYPVVRALPSGHPILDEEDFEGLTSYTIPTALWPEGFQVPTETLTGLPEDVSVGPTAVYGSNGVILQSLTPEQIDEVDVESAASKVALTSVGMAIVGVAVGIVGFM